MNKARSIKQNPTLTETLPDFRNLGVTLRILLICNGLALLQAFLLAGRWGDILPLLMQSAALLTPTLLSCLLLLWLAQPWLGRLNYSRGALVVTTSSTFIALAMHQLTAELFQAPEYHEDNFASIRQIVIAVSMCATLLMYFRWRTRVLSRALEEARLQVLRARIRPHFLFNTINAVLSIVRSQPKRAETALEDMSDLFRMAMSEAPDLVPLGQELALCRQYIALEQLRMGERLQLDWQLNNMPNSALIPPLLLQPLLENAVYHGIEPLMQGGTITVKLQRIGHDLRIEVENPCPPRATPQHHGNRMALQNIRERLALLFDVEANYRVDASNERYRVQITLPYSEKER
jgi:two-component system sensor histidine kinase AlgZ